MNIHVLCGNNIQRDATYYNQKTQARINTGAYHSGFSRGIRSIPQSAKPKINGHCTMSGVRNIKKSKYLEKTVTFCLQPFLPCC